MKTKRITILLLCLLLILNTFAGSVSAAGGEYNKEDIFLLKEDFNYAPDLSTNHGWMVYNTSYYTFNMLNTLTKVEEATDGWKAGSGWSLQNYAEQNSTRADCSLQWNSVTEVSYLQTRNNNGAYRQMENAISCRNNGVYYFISENAASTSLTQHIPTVDNRMMFGNEANYVGLKYITDGFYAQMNFNGTLITGTKKYDTADGIRFIYVAKLEVKDGKLTLKFKVYPKDGAEPKDWELVSEAAAVSDIKWIGFNSAAPSVPMGTYSLRAEKYTGEYYSILSDYEAVLEKAENGTLTENDLVNQMEKAAELFDCEAKKEILGGISALAEEFGYADALANKITGSNPENLSHVYCEDIENITIDYRYALNSVGDVATISDGESTIYGDVELNGKNIIITPEEALSYNKSYSVTLSDAVNFDGNAISDNSISFTTSIVPPVNLKDGETYGVGRKIEWDQYTGITTTATVKINGGEETEFTNGEVFSEQGEYVLTLYSAENDGEKTEEREFSFTVLPAYPPEAQNLKIKGTMATDETIEADYDFVDKNSDKEGASVYQWYRAAEINGEYEPITTNGTSKTYTLTTEDENMYLRYEVTPVALSESETTGETALSEPYAGPFKPTAENITIKAQDGKKIKKGTILEVSFSYNDLNGNENEGEHSYTWYRKGSEDEEPIGEGKTYTITEDDYNNQIYVKIVPETTLKPYDGDETSSEMIYAPTRPTAKNVKITGTAKVGQTISGVYTFHDVNGDDEAETTGYWIDADSGAKIGNGHSLKLTSNMEGMNVKYVVVTESVEEPKEGEKVESTSVKIAASGGSGGGGGGGFSYSGSTSGSIKTETKDPSYEIKPTEPKPEVNTDSFSDLKGHWAEESIKELKKAGLINGISEEEFAPEKNVSRAEFVSMMVRLAGWEKADYKEVFNDVKADNWFSADVITAFEKGLISEDAAFRPNDSITRAEVAKLSSIIAELLDYAAPENSTEAEFSDASEIPAWATEYIASANKKGIMRGDDSGNIRANAFMTRAEAATILWRLYKGGKA